MVSVCWKFRNWRNYWTMPSRRLVLLNIRFQEFLSCLRWRYHATQNSIYSINFSGIERSAGRRTEQWGVNRVCFWWFFIWFLAHTTGLVLRDSSEYPCFWVYIPTKLFTVRKIDFARVLSGGNWVPQWKKLGSRNSIRFVLHRRELALCQSFWHCGRLCCQQMALRF